MTETQKGAVMASQHCDRQQDQMTQGREVHAEVSVLKNTKNICCPSFASPARMFGAAFFASVHDTLPETCPMRFCYCFRIFFGAGQRSVEKILGKDRVGLPFSFGPGRGGACIPAHTTVMKRK